ncbi:alanine dehydrogenase [Corallococcus exiguus]|uniref:alanine dehydrogenase n=1 Tax=Corallococcus TaxID=83461 RepID=UPI000EA21CFE|nr:MULTISPECIES: alanine dehydrogenase [unclassified Corallococcus]NNC21789.1 alanine dehydrogenase [Corallococcus exiguus]NRD59096.1 alanine dehydrogenase [Corallococcus exiguus]NRD66853.1 alanine dehydrogenase [Corallococcus exiguus]RKH29043.1 alanine dehydrogenase [Corallococcus sp. CA041A]RKH96333.1 alanine dehydrogenase [Corallococcus sp. AB030]
MIVGVPKEIKTREYRVGMVPAGVRALTIAGHTVLVETNAGVGSGIPDSEYQRVGAQIITTADEVWKRAEMIVKVKEPIAPEYERMQPGQIVYTYFHLAGVDPELTKTLIKKKVTAVAYETLQLDDGSLPLLKPMSEVAGKMAIQVGAACLEKAHGGKGILLGGVPGVRRGRVAVIGGGVVGLCAAKVAVGMGAEVTILDVNLERLTYLDDVFLGHAQTLASDTESIARTVRESDLVVGAVLIPGGKAPKLVSRELIGEMEPGSVVVDVAVDQGGCIETCKPTTHDNPTFTVSDVVHYCVANMPGAVPQTSTFALTNTTRPYSRKIADLGLVEAIKSDRALQRAINTYNGHITYEAVAKDMGYDYVPLMDALGGKK